MYFLLIIPILLVLYFFCLKGRTGHPLVAELRKWKYGHRGLYNAEKPENSLAAFRNAVSHGFGSELDVHLLKDGNLAVLHDSNLKRMTGRDVMIEDLTASDLEHYRLNGTDERIPLFSEVLSVFDGKTPLIVELKTAGNNYAALCQKACQMLDGYHGLYCLESFDPRCIWWLRRHRPDLVRGQLSENWYASPSKLPFAWKVIMTSLISNLLTRPDFIAFRYQHRNRLGVKLCRNVWRVAGVSWTIPTQKDLDIALEEGWIPIFENFVP